MKKKRQARFSSFLNNPAYPLGPTENDPKQTNEQSVLTYKNGDTLELCDKSKKLFRETDAKFIEDVGNIAKVKKNMFLEMLNTGLPSMKLSDKVCDELDYIARKHCKANKVNENSRRSF